MQASGRTEAGGGNELEPAENLEGHLTVIGPTVVLKGELSAGQDLMIIRGQVHGSVTGETIVLRKGARLKGDISAARIRLERGVEFGDVVLSGRIAKTARE